jgi:hypothetical protein
VTFPVTVTPLRRAVPSGLTRVRLDGVLEGDEKYAHTR